MARRTKGIPVSELASDLRISAGELRQRMGAAGMLRHLLPDDSIPVGMMDRVSVAVRKQGPSALGAFTEEPSAPGMDLHKLMAATGVKPIRQAGRGPKPQITNPWRQKTSVRPSQSPRRPASPQAPSHELAARLERAKSANAELAGRNRALQEQLDAARGEQALAQTRAQVAEDALLALRADLVSESGQGSIVDLLESRGLIGEDERSAAIRALISVRRWDAIASSLRPTDLSLSRTALELHVVLACGQGDCEAPAQMGWVQVTPRRCEVCAGQGRKRHLRRLGDAMLLHGLRRVALLGGPAGYRKLVRENLDERIKVLTGVNARSVDLSQVQCILAWGEMELPESNTPVIRLKGRGLVELVEGVREGLAAGQA